MPYVHFKRNINKKNALEECYVRNSLSRSYIIKKMSSLQKFSQICVFFFITSMISKNIGGSNFMTEGMNFIGTK